MSLSITTLANAIKAEKSLVTEAEVTTETDAVQNTINSKQATVSGGATTIINSELSASKCLISNSSGKVAVSTVSADKLDLLSGVTSSIQDQLDAKLLSSELTGAISTITHLPNLTPSKILISNNDGKITESTIDESKLQYLSNTTTNVQSDLDGLTSKFNLLNSLSLDDSGNIVSWSKPTGVSSITSQSSLPGTYKLVKNKTTRLRITLDSSVPLHSNKVSKMISSIQITVDGTTSSLNLATSGITIDVTNKTIDFNYIASSLSQHDITLKLREANIISIGSIISDNYTISILGSDIFEFPTIGTTSKNSPHDTADVTVGQSISMTSAFSGSLDSNLSTTIVISDGTTNPSVTSSISGANLNYSFTIANDADHSGNITLNFGNTSNSYSWSATGLLTAADDIYTFPNIISYDGSGNGYDSGMHLLTNTPSTLILTFTGGDQLHSNTYSDQLSGITYKTGASGSVINVSSSNISINSSNETITVSNINVTDVEDIYFTVTLIGPDGTVMQSALSFIIPNTSVQPDFITAEWAWPTGNTSEPIWYSNNGNGLFNSTFGSGGDNNVQFRDWVTSLMDPLMYYVGWWPEKRFDWYDEMGVHGNSFGNVGNGLQYQQVYPYLYHRGMHTGGTNVISPEGRYWLDHPGSTAVKPLHYQFGHHFRYFRYTSEIYAGWLQAGSNKTWSYPFGFTSPGTITRVWWKGIESSSYYSSTVWRFTGYTNRDDLYNRTNGIVLLEITGRNWWSTWTPFTTTAIVTHILWEKVTDDYQDHAAYWWPHFGQ